jgi:hypothetical protein
MIDTFLNEDGSITTSDPTGNGTPGFPIDDGIAANDTDVEGGVLSVQLVDPPAHAAAFNLNADGTFFYQPLPNFNGNDTFTYRVNDGVLNSNNIGTVTLTVNEVNDAPIARDDELTIDEDVPLNIDQSELLANDDAGPDPNEDSQTLVITSVDSFSAQGGTVSLEDGRVIYTPPSNFSGTDTFVYTVTDNGTTGGVPAPLSASATVTVIVLDKNDPPTTGVDSLTTAEDTPGTIAISTLLSNDIPGPPDEAHQTLTFLGVQAQSTNGGTVVVDGDNVIYTPPLDFVGTDTFFYEVQDDGTSGGVFDPATSVGTVSVTVTPVNDAPRIQMPFGEVSMQEDEAPRSINLGNIFFDPDVTTNGDMLSFTVVSNSNGGLVTATVNGDQLMLQLVADQNGSSLIEVEARDQAGATARDTLTLTVVPVNDAPRLVQPIPDIIVDEGDDDPEIVLTPQYFFDPDVALNGDTLTLAVASNSNPLLVMPIIVGNRLRLQLADNRSGVSTITVSATDSFGLSINDTFNLVVNEVNNVPITAPDSYTVPQGATLTTTDPFGVSGGPEDDGVLANDRDPEGQPLTAVLVSGPQFASSFTLNANGTFSYRHNGASRTTDSFTYRASDGVGQSVVTTVTINIGDPLPPPHQNPVFAMDVNADGFLSPIDALLIINLLNTNIGDGSVENLPPPPPYRDVDGNNFITALDALLVINALNDRLSGGEGEGEGEGALSSTRVDTAGSAFALSDALGFQFNAARAPDNSHLEMRLADRPARRLQGPAQPNIEEQVYGLEDLIGDSDWATGLIGNDDPLTDESIDLALTSLLGDEGLEEPQL